MRIYCQECGEETGVAFTPFAVDGQAQAVSECCREPLMWENGKPLTEDDAAVIYAERIRDAAEH